jgi:hypothetical protein
VPSTRGECHRRRLLINAQENNVVFEMLEAALHCEDLSLCGEEGGRGHGDGVLAGRDDEVESAVSTTEGAAEFGLAVNRDTHARKRGARRCQDSAVNGRNDITREFRDVSALLRSVCSSEEELHRCAEVGGDRLVGRGQVEAGRPTNFGRQRARFVSRRIEGLHHQTVVRANRQPSQ